MIKHIYIYIHIVNALFSPWIKSNNSSSEESILIHEKKDKISIIPSVLYNKSKSLIKEDKDKKVSRDSSSEKKSELSDEVTSTREYQNAVDESKDITETPKVEEKDISETSKSNENKEDVEEEEEESDNEEEEKDKEVPLESYNYQILKVLQYKKADPRPPIDSSTLSIYIN